MKFNSSSILFNQIAWQAHEVAITNSTSRVDKVTIGCFLDDHETNLEPNMKAYLKVLFQLSKSAT